MSTGTRASQLAMHWRGRLTGQPRAKALLGWQSYYRRFLEESAARSLIDHRGPYVGDDTRQEQLIEAIAGGRGTFLISAPAGCGKSRFVLELARTLARAQRSWDVRFVRHDEPALTEELQADPKTSRTILIVDDAQDCPALVRQLVCWIAEPAPAPRHLLCLARPAARTALLEALASPLHEPLELDLGRPDARTLRQLIDALIPQLSPHHRDVIRRFVADSYFAAVLLCSSVARQKKLPQTLSTRNLRDYAVREPIAQAIGDSCPPQKALHALAVYAACAPVRAGEAAVRHNAATLAALPMGDIEALENRALEAGLFEIDGRGMMRPLPDLVGDLILEECCLDEEGRATPFGQSLLRVLLEQRQYQTVITRCGELARLLSRPPRVELLSDLLWERVTALTPQTRAAAAELLRGCAQLAVHRPDVAVRLIDALVANGVLRGDSAAEEERIADSPEICAHQLLLAAARSDPALVPRALADALSLSRHARGEDGRALIVDSLEEFCRFAVARPLAHAKAALSVLSKWSEESDAQMAQLAATLAQGYLPLQMQVHHRDAQTAVAIGLQPAEDLCKLRDQALAIVVRCASHDSPAVALAAAQSLGQWAQGLEGLASERRHAWDPQLIREMDLLAACFAKLGSTTSHLPVRAAIERQGWVWWMEGAEPFVRRGGSRLLQGLPAGDPYSLWKALCATGLPIFPLPVEESIEPALRRDHLLPLVTPSAARMAELARELFDRLDAGCSDSAAWSSLLTAVVTALPMQPLHPGAGVYLQELVRRHPGEAWSLITEESAAGALGVLLPALLAQLRGRDRPRWHEAIRSAVAGTRLFEMQLHALCASADLDSEELASLARGLQLEDAQLVHLCAQALLRVPGPALTPALAAVFASLSQRPQDVRLWELTLEAFARWGEPLLELAADAQAEPADRAAAGELLRLLRASGSSLFFTEGAHTACLAQVLAILAVTVPHTLKTWMRQQAMSDTTQADSVLLPARLAVALRLLSKSPAAAFWRKQFLEWMTQEPELALLGARSLVALCGLGDACIPPMVMRIVEQPSDDSLEALGELVRSSAAASSFIPDALALLRQLVDAPEAYDRVEREFISASAGRGGMLGAAAEAGNATLAAIQRAQQDGDLPQRLRESLARVRQAVEGAIQEELLRGEAC